jgi:hypothetical protein
MSGRQPRWRAVLVATALVAAPAGVLATPSPAGAVRATQPPAPSPTATTPNDATGSSGRGFQRSPAALRLIDPMSAGPRFSAEPGCGWGPGLPASGAAPVMCVHADSPPAGVDVRRDAGTAELRGRPGAAAGATRAARTVLAAEASSAGSPSAGSPSAADLSTPASTSSVQCYGTGVDGNRVQAIYAVPSGSPNRYASLAGAIKVWAAGVDGVVNRSAALTGGTRHVRFVTSRSGGVCTPTVLNVTLPAGSAASFDATITALEAKGFTSPHRKYLVWMDAAQLCGIATLYQDSVPGYQNYNNGQAPQYARIDEPCWGYPDSVEAHELTHTLGAVQPDAPHHTTLGHCYDEYDRMCYDDGSGIPMQGVCSLAWDRLLDCRSDDYFSTHPVPASYLATHWNTAMSSFLSSAGALQVSASAAAAVPGLPSTVTAAVSLSAGRRLRALTLTSSDPHCTVTRTSATAARLLCAPTVTTAPTVRVTATDSSGQSAAATVTPTLDLSSRPATLELTVGGETVGAGAWCDAVGTLRARLVDDATGVAVSGLTATFRSSTTAGGTQTLLGQAASGSTGIALLRTPLTADYLHASTPNTGPWQADTAVTAQALTISACTGVVTAALSRTAAGYADPVTISGTLRGDAAGHQVPLPGRVVTVQLHHGTRVVLLGRATVTDSGTWALPVRAVLDGVVRATSVTTSGVTGDTVLTPRLTVASWATATQLSASRATMNRAAGYRVIGRVVRAKQPSTAVAYSVLEVWYTAPHASARRVAVVTVGSTGRFAVWTRAAAGGVIRVRVLARVGYLASTSAAVRLS